MILKRPYAFFIRMFKPIHLILSVVVGYLFYLNNNILIFLNQYMYSSESLISKEQIVILANKFIYIIPLLVLFFFLLLLGIMYKKKKPMILYFVGIFVFLCILVINIYTINFFGVISQNIVSIKTVKLIHDLVLINLILEVFYCILLFIRGLGLDFKKFDFSSDISKIEISESDREEIEVGINIDFNEKKRKRKQKLRNLKYLYIENKFIINIVFTFLIVIIAFLLLFIIIKKNNVNKEGYYYSASSFNFKVNNTTLLNSDYRGNKITDNYLVVVNVDIKSNYSDNSLFLNDFSLKIENIKFKPTTRYDDSIADLGIPYKEQKLTLENTNYIFVFEIPEKYISSDMYFSYNSEGNYIDVLINAKKILGNETSITKKLKENIKFEGTLSGTEFRIDDYEISDKILINYNYCIKDNDCIPSIEYLKPTINENYDKVILKMNVDYSSKSDIDVNNFYKLLSKFGSIYYNKNGVWYSIAKFEEIISTKTSSNNVVYVGVNSDVTNADSIKILFKIRDLKYEYILK